jgi:magnesium chelatase subunit I
VSLPRTLGELKRSGWKSRPVKDEMRENLVAMLRGGAELFPGIVGYEKTVVPALVNAILSRHDFILLGLRGQAKTRILRSLARFLDERLPVLEGTEINDDPYRPVSRRGRELVAKLGDGAPVAWLGRDERYKEKLATPDVTIADLIGDIDPIKAAAMRLSYADEEVIHYGIIPRTNRGIFAINELPDLPPRIQVGLLNIMEEKDIQVRGFPVRMPLDILMVYSANPEDYTNRGNIITPLKDRIDSQIMTHYPRERDAAVRITAQEAWTERGGPAAADGCRYVVPAWYRELVEEVAFAARKSEYVNQSSGVSARMSISLLENVVSNMERRAIRHREKVVHPRISDLAAAVPAVTGKIELVYEGEQQGAEIVARKIVGEAVKETFRRFFPDPVPPKRRKKRRAGDEEADEEDDVPAKPEKSEPSPYQAVLAWFSRGNTLETSDETSEAEHAARLAKVAGLAELARRHPGLDGEDGLPLVMELLVEGLHQHSMVSKWMDEDRASYRDMLKSMFERMGTSSPN